MAAAFISTLCEECVEWHGFSDIPVIRITGLHTMCHWVPGVGYPTGLGTLKMHGQFDIGEIMYNFTLLNLVVFRTPLHFSGRWPLSQPVVYCAQVLFTEGKVWSNRKLLQEIHNLNAVINCKEMYTCLQWSDRHVTTYKTQYQSKIKWK